MYTGVTELLAVSWLLEWQRASQGMPGTDCPLTQASNRQATPPGQSCLPALRALAEQVRRVCAVLPARPDKLLLARGQPWGRASQTLGSDLHDVGGVPLQLAACLAGHDDGPSMGPRRRCMGSHQAQQHVQARGVGQHQRPVGPLSAPHRIQGGRQVSGSHCQLHRHMVSWP